MPKVTKTNVQRVAVEWSEEELHDLIAGIPKEAVFRVIGLEGGVLHTIREGTKLVATWTETKEAAKGGGLDPRRFSDTQRAVYEVIKSAEDRGGITDKRVAAMFPNITIHTVHKARQVLLQAGLIRGIGRAGKEVLWVLA
jgi:hypothetical protein